MILLALLLAQDGVENWVRDLHHDDPARREAAEAKLVEAGASALPALRPLCASSDIDVSSRATRIIEFIERGIRRAAALGKVVRVDLDLKQTPFREALAELERRSGFQTWVAPDVEDRPITTAIKDSPWLEAIDLLCRAHGDVRLKVVQWDDEAPGFLQWRDAEPARRARFALARGKATNSPAINDGPFRISIAHVSQTCATNSDLFTLIMRRTWQPNARPVGIVGHEVEALGDDTGRSLLTDADVASSKGARREPNRYQGCDSYTWPRTLPSRDAKSIDVRGTTSLWFATEAAPVRIERPESHVGSSYEIGEFNLELMDCTASGETAKVVVKGTCKSTFAWKNERGMPHDLVEIRCYDEGGKELRFSSRAMSPDQTSCTYDIQFKLKAGQTISAIEFRSWWDFWQVDVPFEFKAVPLPQW